MSKKRCASVSPIAAIGDEVTYVDRQSRLQFGEVLRVRASWNRAGEPRIIYECSHPSARNRRLEILEKNITSVLHG